MADLKRLTSNPFLEMNVNNGIMKYVLSGLYQFFMRKTGDKTMSKDMVVYWVCSGCTIEDVLKRYSIGG